uniref:Immunoglobulin V-set domain-containing protein n=1 Tax=Pyxicephalus adspersus TaxID=30357 RepID=A0AAV3AC86_PYXAD|nr:TPA: hypothetical protein GDO54_013627 [Pyxicephalus adspersus]
MEATLDCSYDQSGLMIWYVQKPGQSFMVFVQDYTKEDDLEEEYKGRLFYSNDKTNKKFPLNITKTRVSDSGIYYCVYSATVCNVHKQDVQ